MQELRNPWGVSAYGTATVRAKPDLARIQFQVVRTGTTAAAAFETTRSVVGEVRRVLRDHDVPDTAVERSELGLETERDHKAGRRVVGDTVAKARRLVASRHGVGHAFAPGGLQGRDGCHAPRGVTSR